MTTPKRTVSPAVKRALEAQARKGHKAITKAEATLGDRVPADAEHAEHPRRDASGLPICSIMCACS